ncbi:DUF3500 domain-containing protein [Salinifilum ghardaiensis]
MADLGHDAAKAAHQLLATTLSPQAFAQTTNIMGLEEVLDRVEHGENQRHHGHYWIAVFGSQIENTRGAGQALATHQTPLLLMLLLFLCAAAFAAAATDEIVEA